jgi:hypothetical protein
MQRFFLIILLVFLVFRIIRNFLRGYSSGYNKNFRDNSKRTVDYKNIEEANYTEIKDEEETR